LGWPGLDQPATTATRLVRKSIARHFRQPFAALGIRGARATAVVDAEVGPTAVVASRGRRITLCAVGDVRSGSCTRAAVAESRWTCFVGGARASRGPRAAPIAPTADSRESHREQTSQSHPLDGVHVGTFCPCVQNSPNCIPTSPPRTAEAEMPLPIRGSSLHWGSRVRVTPSVGWVHLHRAVRPTGHPGGVHIVRGSDTSSLAVPEGCKLSAAEVGPGSIRRRWVIDLRTMLPRSHARWSS